MNVETCSNCGGTIGKLEMPHGWGGQIVCAACFDRLSRQPQQQQQQQRHAPAYAMHAAPPIVQHVQPGQIIGPNPRCGYVGPPRMQPKGSTGLGCLLMFFFILPGLIYLLVTRGNRYSCPRCGLLIGSD